MLYLSIPLALLVLVCGQLAARRHPHSVWWDPYIYAVVAPVFGFCVCFFTAPLIQAAVIFPPLLAWPYIRRYVRTFVPFSLLGLVIGYGFAFKSARETVEKYDELRDRHPYESMEERVPVPLLSDDPPAGVTAAHLDEFETNVESARHTWRTRSLRQLHEDRVRLFVNAPGFGALRNLTMGPTERSVSPEPRPDTPAQETPSPTPHDRCLSATDETDLLELHGKGSLDFVNPAGFGFVKDRNHVSGFLPHGFSETPAATSRWQVDRIELIGLLLHPEPVVYVSERLPSMTKVRDIPTRPLDEFEANGLVTLRRGGTLAVGTVESQARMLGALRSARQCVECHGGQRGDLLGAFSYTFRPINDKP